MSNKEDTKLRVDQISCFVKLTQILGPNLEVASQTCACFRSFERLAAVGYLQWVLILYLSIVDVILYSSIDRKIISNLSLTDNSTTTENLPISTTHLADK